jgi:nucleotide-binding universal stress UspA family protein
MYKRILIPLDGSALAEQALPHAISQARHFQAELILLRVVEPFAHVGGMSLAGLERIRQQTRIWVDLIVMSTRGQSGLSRWLMGSVADRVVRGATVPVLLVRARKEKE